LLPEAEEKLSEVVPDYPLANTLAALGVFIVLILQQITIIYSSPKKTIPQKGTIEPITPIAINQDITTEKWEFLVKVNTISTIPMMNITITAVPTITENLPKFGQKC
jgi:hypothetical protein